MFTLSTLLLFVAGALALIASPGPDFLYVLGRGVAGGRRAGVLSALGIALGLCVHTALAVAGLTALLLASSAAFNIVKWAGAIYLIYLGAKTLLARDETSPSENAPILQTRAVVWQGFLTNVFNPKAALTFALFLPQFVTQHRHDTTLQVAILGALMVLMAGAWFSFVGSCAGTVGAWLSRNPKVQTRVRLATGGLFVLLGVRLALAKR